MLSVLLLLVLSAGSIQDSVENQPLGAKVSPLELGLEKDVLIKTSARFRQKRQLDSSSSMPVGMLQWVKWKGFLPNGAVSIYNKYESRTDFICKVRCRAGFYNPRKGPYCHYPDKKERRSSSFQVLVNENNFEILEWKKGSSGSVPKNSIRTCSRQELFIGKNKYGLGMVYPKDKCFYLPWKGKQYWYKRSYEVLTQLKAESNVISDVKYDIKKDTIFKTPPKAIQSSTTTNNALSPVTQTVSLTKTTTDERRWDISSSIKFSSKLSISAGIPGIGGGTVEIGVETTHTFSGGNTWREQISHSVSTQLTVPPNHSCTVKMVGYKYKMEIPFTARLSHIYEDQETRSVIISGTYHGVQVGDIRAEMEKCKPLSNSKRVSENM